MKEDKVHIHYTSEDIAKYLQGQMNHAEMYRLEMAALKDPFLADAIDGYSNTEHATTAKHLQEIEHRIVGNRHAAKVVELDKGKNISYFKMAAAILGIGVTAYLTSFLFTNKKQEVVVANNKVKIDTSLPKFENGKKEEISKNEIAVFNRNETIDNVNAKTERKIEDNIALNNEKNVDTPKQLLAFKTTESDFYNRNNFDKESPSFKVEENTLANKNITNKDTNVSTLNYSNAIASNNNNVGFNNSNILSQKPRSGYSLDNNSTNNNSNNFINLNNIVVKKDKNYTAPEPQSIGKSKSKQALAKMALNNTYKLTKEDSLLVPENGWDAFNEYLRNNTKQVVYLDSSRKSNYSVVNAKTGETVTLEFDVDDKGNPTNIFVANGIDNLKDSTAINLLKNGPKWSSNANDDKKNESRNIAKPRGKVKINFNN